MKLKHSGFGSNLSDHFRIQLKEYQKPSLKSAYLSRKIREAFKGDVLLYIIKKDKFVQIYSLLLKRIRPESRYKSNYRTSYLTF
jgi:hypothetical protein